MPDDLGNNEPVEWLNHRGNVHAPGGIMEPPGAKEPRSTTVWLLVCLWVSLILTCTGIGVALCAGFLRTFEQALAAGMEQALEPFGTVFDFLGNLEVGHIEMAYALTTEGFQSRHNLNEFAEFVAKYRQL